MARIRTIKPEFFKNEELAELPAMVRLLFIGLWTQADREGKLEDRPKRLKAEIFPYENYDVDKALDSLQKSGFIIRYKNSVNIGTQEGENAAENEEVSCILIKNFTNHQKIDKINEKPSKLPDYQQDNSIVYQKTTTSLPKVGEGKGREGEQGRERKEFLPQAAKQTYSDFIPTQEQIEKFNSFKDWMDRNTPTVAKMEIPITIKEFCKIIGDIPDSKGRYRKILPSVCKTMLLNIENNKQYLRKYRSPYLCILNWSENKK